MIIEALVFGGGAYAGSKAVDFWGQPGLLSRLRNSAKQLFQAKEPPAVVEAGAHLEPDMWQASRNVAVALTSLKLATAGALLNVPTISLASMPFMVYVFIPVFKNAKHKLLVEQRINDQVLVASRVTVCVVMGYTFIASLDATLYTASQWMWARNEKTFRQTLRDMREKHPTIPLDKLPVLIEPYVPDHFQHGSEHSGERMAPLMLGAFVLSIPLMGINRAAAFLTTTFGSHLRYLGPYATRQLIMQACQDGILLTKVDALGRMTEVDTLLIDEKLLEDTELKPLQDDMLTKLRGYYGNDAVHILTKNAEGMLEHLQASGNKTCFISRAADASANQAAFLNIVWQMPDEAGLESSDIVLLGENVWEQLTQLKHLADTLAERQRYNFRATTGSDIVDIGTTVFLDFGLVYSVLFTYTGISLGVLNNHSRRSVREISLACSNSASNDSLTADGSKFSSVPPFSKCC